MGRRALLVATLTVLALGDGLMRQAGIRPPVAPSTDKPEIGTLKASSGGKAQKRIAESRRGQRLAFTDRLPLNSALEDVDWPGLPIPIHLESDGPPIDVGEPLEVDDEWSAELALKPHDPIDIGVKLDASDPQAWTLEASPEWPVDIGTHLDAEDLEVWDLGVSAEESMEIGRPLDADDQSSGQPDELAGAPN